jgi:DNA-binding winged helix-turn-helix (wHTH) protein
VQAAETSALLLRFGTFELNLRTNELRRSGVLIKLAPQQLQTLRLLAESAGQVLTREQIQRELWGDGTFVDFDRNLNVCIAQIRAALNDDSDAPRYIQTIPKRGYRFIATGGASQHDTRERIAIGAAPGTLVLGRHRRVARFLQHGGRLSCLACRGEIGPYNACNAAI